MHEVPRIIVQNNHKSKMNSCFPKQTKGARKNVSYVHQKKKTTEKSDWETKVVDAIKEYNGEKMSLSALKKALAEAYGIDMSNARNKMKLKEALINGVEKEQLKKVSGSYQMFDIEKKEIDSDEDNLETKACHPVDVNWKGLSIKKREKAKSCRSTCKSCTKSIEKGAWRLEVVDDSLFQMCIAPGDCHEGVSRGYVECVPPDGSTVSRKIFFIHEHCLEEANKRFEIEFRQKWEIIQPHWNVFLT